MITFGGFYVNGGTIFHTKITAGDGSFTRAFDSCMLHFFGGGDPEGNRRRFLSVYASLNKRIEDMRNRIYLTGRSVGYLFEFSFSGRTFFDVVAINDACNVPEREAAEYIALKYPADIRHQPALQCGLTRFSLLDENVDLLAAAAQ